MYVMIARTVEIPVAGEPKTFRIVQYRKLEITSPTGTFSDEPIKLADVLAQPACPPPSEIRESAATAFTKSLIDHYGECVKNKKQKRE